MADPLCGIPARTLPPCDLEWGHEGDLHGNAGDGFYARDHDDEHHRRQTMRDGGEPDRPATVNVSYLFVPLAPHEEAMAAIRQIDGYESQMEILEAFVDGAVRRETHVSDVREEGRVEERRAIQKLALDHYDINAFLHAIRERDGVSNRRHDVLEQIVESARALVSDDGASSVDEAGTEADEFQALKRVLAILNQEER